MTNEADRPKLLKIDTADGIALEAEINSVHSAHAFAVISHPHPLYGGNFQNEIVESLFRELPNSGIATLRYNFRGVGKSEGSFGEGIAEQLDTAAAFEYAQGTEVACPLISVGYSFGADVSFAVDHSLLKAWVGIAPPLSLIDPKQMKAGSDDRPAFLVVPEQDQYRPPTETKLVTSEWRSTRMQVIPGANHFLANSSSTVVELVKNYILSVC